MIEKVNPGHPDKVADRIAGAIVDLAYTKDDKPKVAVEILIGHGECNIIIESSVEFSIAEISEIVDRISESKVVTKLHIVPQDIELAKNQKEKLRSGDNGIFKGVPLTAEQKEMSEIAHLLYDRYGSDGKYVLDEERSKLIICQSNATNIDIEKLIDDNYDIKTLVINPLGEWTGGTEVDTGATNRKLGSDMADAVTGGGLHGKDLSKADVAVNIYAFLRAQKENKVVELNCAIGDDTIDGKPFGEIVEIAKEYINSIGGFEKLAEWGLF